MRDEQRPNAEHYGRYEQPAKHPECGQAPERQHSGKQEQRRQKAHQLVHGELNGKDAEARGVEQSAHAQKSQDRTRQYAYLAAILDAIVLGPKLDRHGFGLVDKALAVADDSQWLDEIANDVL